MSIVSENRPPCDICGEPSMMASSLGIRCVKHIGDAARSPNPNEADWGDDRPLPEDSAIAEAFPTRSGRHDLYAEAMRLVGAKRSKGALVALVNWLLHSVDAGEKGAAAEKTATIGIILCKCRAPETTPCIRVRSDSGSHWMCPWCEIPSGTEFLVAPEEDERTT